MELSSEFADLKQIFNDTPCVIAGPCSAETEEQLMSTAQELVKAGIKVMRAGIWKPRTRPGGYEGSGEKGLAWLQNIKKETGLKLAIEVGTTAQVELALKAGIDYLWVGARTTCDPFAVQDVADALKGVDVPVLIKNPLVPDLALWLGAVERIHRAGITRLGAILRGFYTLDEKKYRNDPMWDVVDKFRAMVPNLPIVFDPSHTGGKREYIAELCQEAMKRNYNGLMVESHFNPDAAWTDAAQQITPQQLRNILDGLGIH